MSLKLQQLVTGLSDHRNEIRIYVPSIMIAGSCQQSAQRFTTVQFTQADKNLPTIHCKGKSSHMIAAEVSQPIWNYA